MKIIVYHLWWKVTIVPNYNLYIFLNYLYIKNYCFSYKFPILSILEFQIPKIKNFNGNKIHISVHYFWPIYLNNAL